MSDLESDWESDRVSDLVRDWVGEMCMGDLVVLNLGGD